MNKQILELEKLATELEQMATSLKIMGSDIFNLNLSLIIEEFHIYHNTGISLKEQGQINEALHWYSKAKQVIPEIFVLQNQRKYDIAGNRKKKKKKFTAYGNCQAPALAKFLEHFESFTNSYEYIAIEPVHLMTNKDINEFYNIIPELDLLIYQPVLSSYKNNPQFGYKNIISKLKSNSCYISFPSIYFFGYYPELTYITNIPSVFPFNDKRTEFILHDKNIIKYFLENRTVEEIEFLMNKLDYYNIEFLTTNLQESINELRKRESGLNIDIPISNFIEENYDKLKLFHELNHPNYYLLKYVADKILARLNLSSEGNFYFDPLYTMASIPLYPSTHFQLDIKFKDIDHYMILGNATTKHDVIKMYCDGYKSIDRKLLENSIINWNPP